MTSETYNGWTNIDTWRVFTNLSNDERTYNICKQKGGKFLRSFWNHNRFPDSNRVDSLNVNWKEIAESLN